MKKPKIDLVELSKKYAGRWVALDPDDGHVLASGDSAVDVLAAAEALGAELPILLQVWDDYGDWAFSALHQRADDTPRPPSFPGA